MLKAAIRDDNPVIMFEGERLYALKGEVPEGEHVVPLGKADVKREGKDVTIITWARMYYFCRAGGAEQLEKEGISRGDPRPAHAAAAGRGGDPRHRCGRPTAW